MLTTVATFDDPWNAHILRGRLEAEGLFALVVDERLAGYGWPWALAFGGVRVQVPDEECEAAIAIARLCRAGDFRHALEPVFGPLGDTCCPHCRSADFKSRRSIPRLFLQAILYVYLGVIIPLTSRVRRCRQCGTKWSDRFG